MTLRYLAIALAAGACGQVVDGNHPDAAGGTDATNAVAYKALLPQTTPVTFGGTPFCTYTITLKQLELDLSILPSQQASSGHLQDLNTEATDASCPNGVIPANIATYTLSTSTPITGGQMLTFQGGATNAPVASLVATLKPAGSGYTAALTFHRTDSSNAVLNWTVTTTVTLAPQ